MAGHVEMPDPIEKRNVLASKTVPDGEILALANAYLEQDALSDACDFFDKIGHAEGLERVKRRAIEIGNAHVLAFDMGRSRHVEVSKEDWQAAGENALAQGKFAYAAQAFAKSGDAEKEEQARRQVPGVPRQEEPGLPDTA